MHEYAFHLMCYHDNQFCQHPRFFYYLYNILMHHLSQAITVIFIKECIENNLPTTVSDIWQCFYDFPNSKFQKQVMCFGAVLWGTHSYWNKWRCELIDMIAQIWSPTFFFTLSAVDTKWSDLHMFMYGSFPSNSTNLYQWRIRNVIKNPHTIPRYMHFIFTLFLEEVLQKGFHTLDYWFRFSSNHFLLHHFLHC